MCSGVPTVVPWLSSLLLSSPEMITWRSEFTTDEDLSGVIANKDGAHSDWTPETGPSSTGMVNQNNWADFSVFSSHNELG